MLSLDVSKTNHYYFNTNKSKGSKLLFTFCFKRIVCLTGINLGFVVQRFDPLVVLNSLSGIITSKMNQNTTCEVLLTSQEVLNLFQF